uniref:Uncharacterized protein n=1 Tax=Panagrolaimus superbus TaxID=310955 RepID=A0A914ZAI3_9BILA
MVDIVIGFLVVELVAGLVTVAEELFKIIFVVLEIDTDIFGVVVFDVKVVAVEFIVFVVIGFAVVERFERGLCVVAEPLLVDEVVILEGRDVETVRFDDKEVVVEVIDVAFVVVPEFAKVTVLFIAEIGVLCVVPFNDGIFAVVNFEENGILVSVELIFCWDDIEEVVLL